jgi:hypothetical protein
MFSKQDIKHIFINFPLLFKNVFFEELFKNVLKIHTRFFFSFFLF